MPVKSLTFVSMFCNVMLCTYSGQCSSGVCVSVCEFDDLKNCVCDEGYFTLFSFHTLISNAMFHNFLF